MIRQIEGSYVEQSQVSITLNVQGVFYEVFVSQNVLKSVEGKKEGDSVRLVTFHYVQTDPSKSLPVLIGFQNKIEREFFEKFITVSGVGPKAALRALSVPISEIAQAIDAADDAFLKTLPGVGSQRAREIIAKLQGRVGRFGLIQDGAAKVERFPKSDVAEEALAVLLQLQYRSDEAKRMIQKAMSQDRDIKSVDDVLNEVFRQKTREPVEGKTA